MPRQYFLLYLFLSLLLSSCFLVKIPTLESHKNMPSRKIEKGESSLHLDTNFKDLSSVIVTSGIRKKTLNRFLNTGSSNAFLILKEDQLIFEWYGENWNEQKPHSSFSIAKSFTSALVGIAIDEGKINSVQDKVIQYLPELDSAEFKDLKILHLLQMTGGIRYSELGIFYDTNTTAVINHLKLSFKPGKKQEYWSTTTQLLGALLQRAIEPQTISEYLTEKVWQPMGAEANAEWSLDREGGIEKTFCCIEAVARDYARFGSVYLNNGYYNQQEIIPETWIQESVRINEKEGSVKHYNYGWWIFSDDASSFMARGFRGQYIFIDREKKVVIVRLGSGIEGKLGKKWFSIFSDISKQLK